MLWIAGEGNSICRLDQGGTAARGKLLSGQPMATREYQRVTLPFTSSPILARPASKGEWRLRRLRRALRSHETFDPRPELRSADRQPRCIAQIGAASQRRATSIVFCNRPGSILWIVAGLTIVASDARTALSRSRSSKSLRDFPARKPWRRAFPFAASHAQQLTMAGKIVTSSTARDGSPRDGRGR